MGLSRKAWAPSGACSIAKETYSRWAPDEAQPPPNGAEGCATEVAQRKEDRERRRERGGERGREREGERERRRRRKEKRGRGERRFVSLEKRRFREA